MNSLLCIMALTLAQSYQKIAMSGISKPVEEYTLTLE